MHRDNAAIEEWLQNTDFCIAQSTSASVPSPRSPSRPQHRFKRQRTSCDCTVHPYPTPEPPFKRAKHMMSGVNHTDLDATPRGPSRSFAPPEVPDSPRSQSTTSSQPSLTSRSSKRSRRSEPTSPSKRAFLRTIPRSINIHAYDDSAVGPRAPLGFKELVEGILDIAEGLKTVPQSLQVRGSFQG